MTTEATNPAASPPKTRPPVSTRALLGGGAIAGPLFVLLIAAQARPGTGSTPRATRSAC